MGRKKTSTNAPMLNGAVPTTLTPKGVKDYQQFHEQAEQLRRQGYTALPAALGSGRGNGYKMMLDDYITAQLSCDCGSGKKKDSLPLLHLSSGYAMPVQASNGHKGEYIAWGWGNRLPNVVALLTGMSPYVAAGHEFNTNLIAGMGPRPMYAFTQYVGGNVTSKEIPYDQAGILLRGLIRDRQRELLKLEEEHPELTENLPEGQVSNSVAEQMHRDLREQIADLKSEFAAWERVNAEVATFMRENDLTQVMLHLDTDLMLLYECFPEIGLSSGSFDEATGKTDDKEITGWHPRATKLTYRSSFICRKEKLSPQNKIENVYISNRWLDHPEVTPDPTSIDALPALSTDSPTPDLERLVREARTARVETGSRPTRVIFPVSYPTPGRPYYAVAPWHSIFGDVYIYLMTIVGDRKRRRDNANVIGRIIYLSDEYMQRLYQQRECTTNDDKKKLFNSVISEINTFLKNRDNMGEPLVAYNFTGADGHTYKSWEIVEIEGNSKNTVEANKEELAEISSIVFFAMGTDSQLIGNTPGTTTRSGGTDLRERYLIKQIMRSPMLTIALKPLEVISQFNHWSDHHLVWRIKREVLTTLDNSKTGITNAETE